MPEIFESEKVKPDEKLSKDVLDPKTQKPPDRNSILEVPAGSDRHKIPGHSHNPLSAFCLYPDHITFVNEDPEEHVVLILRKHPVININWVALSLLVTIAPSFLVTLTPLELLPGSFQLVLLLVWYLMVIAFSLEKFLSWFFHVNIVTDERIIEVDFLHLFYREITDANLDQIQDVTVEIGGAVRTVFHYGDVVVQTAAAVPQITFEAVPNPDKVARILRELRIQEETEKLEGRIR